MDVEMGPALAGPLGPPTLPDPRSISLALPGQSSHLAAPMEVEMAWPAPLLTGPAGPIEHFPSGYLSPARGPALPLGS